ncbi:unnamed protein product [Symbiodinium necroappetens]|uniref:Uncharacterized protein n=1 Tax=Symbiodinium necroappetens TaxID=1628268 RepID=A0A813C5V2_9DINO|nr:unnamed protein product [Symbiodinium necroappetens]
MLRSEENFFAWPPNAAVLCWQGCRCTSDLLNRHWLDAKHLSWHEPELVAQHLDESMPATLPLRSLPGYHADMEQADTLHNLWLGPAKDTLGSLFLDVVQFHPQFTGLSWEDGLQALCLRLHDWLSEASLDRSCIDELSLSKLSVDALRFDFPQAFSKAWSNRVGLAFVAAFLRDTQVDELKVPATCAWAVTQVGITMDRAGVWFSEAEAAQMVQCGLLYVQSHVWLAREALLAARARYKVRPRLHSFLCEVGVSEN